MAAMQKLLINLFVATAAVSRGEANRRNDESVMIFFLLPGRGLVAVQAVDALLRVAAHFVFMHHGILRPLVAFGAFSRGSHQIGARLPGLHAGPRPVDQKSRDDQTEGNDDGDEDRSK